MAIEFACAGCGRALTVPDTAAGRRARCPHCRTKGHVPAPALDEQSLAHDPDDEDHDDEHDHDPLLHKKPRKEFHDLIDMTAMVDIVFFLLIYFLVTSLYALKPAIPMPPTEQTGAGGGAGTSADAEREVVVARIDASDVVYVDDVAMASERDLRTKLRDIIKGGGPTQLKIMGSPDATHGTLVMVMDAGAGSGMQKVQLSVKSSEE